jgi:hypothetical protein
MFAVIFSAPLLASEQKLPLNVFKWGKEFKGVRIWTPPSSS